MKAQNDFIDNSIPVTAAPPMTCCHPKVIIWSAVIAGALVVFGLTFLLQIFDKALGIQIIKAATPDTAETLVWGGFIASIVGIIASMFFAGWVSGHVAKYHIFNNSYFNEYAFSRHYGLLYGLLTWCLGLIISLIFIMHMNFTAHYGYHHSYRAPANPTLSVVGMTTQHTASEMTTDSPQGTAASPTGNANAPVTPHFEISLFLTFILFFLGAISSAFGGYCGLKHYRTERVTPVNVNTTI